ncbi:MAG: hypothetical protein ACE14L_16290 [Terriglobales bacterium]
MAHENFESSLVRLLAAEMWLMVSMTASREMFGRSYFGLGVAEKAALDHMVAASIASNYCNLTPEFLRIQPNQVAGFQPQLPVKG